MDQQRDNWWNSGATPEELMLGYFANECMRVTIDSRGVWASCLMAQQLHWHIVQLIGKLHTAGRSRKAFRATTPTQRSIRLTSPDDPRLEMRYAEGRTQRYPTVTQGPALDQVV